MYRYGDQDSGESEAQHTNQDCYRPRRSLSGSEVPVADGGCSDERPIETVKTVPVLDSPSHLSQCGDDQRETEQYRKHKPHTKRELLQEGDGQPRQEQLSTSVYPDLAFNRVRSYKAVICVDLDSKRVLFLCLCV